METLYQDIRYGVRTLLKNPGFSAIAVLALALGIGANTAIFSVVNAVLLKPLPFADPDRLVLLWHSYPSLKLEAPVSGRGFIDYKEQTDIFEEAAVATGWNVNLTESGEPERIQGRAVSAGFFPTLKVEAARGRLFSPEDDQPEHDRVVVLTDGLWKRRFGSDPNIIGKTLTLNGNTFTVIGVLPANLQFDSLGQGVEIYTPVALTPQQRESRGNEWLLMLARLKPGVTLTEARTQLTTIAGRIMEQNPEAYPADWGVTVQSLNERVVGDIRPHLLVLVGAVSFVLLIACANVANLLLARAASRQKEIAIRTALGASRSRLVRQLLTESMLLSIIGGALGLLLALWGVDLLVAVNRNNIPRAGEISIDPWVMGFTLLVSVLTGILFGLVPALQASKTGLNETLKEGGRGTTGGRQRRLRAYLVVSEIALALVLLVGAGLMIKSFVRLLDVDPGFRTQNMLTMQVALPGTKYREPHQVRAFYQRALEQIKALPGVGAASAISNLPLSGSVSSGSFQIEGRPPLAPGEASPHSDRRIITEDYFQTMGVPLMRGRYFTDQDSADSKPVAIIDETMARLYWPDEDPIGKRLSWSSNNGNPVWAEIVGLVGAVRHIGLDAVVRGQLYIPHNQRPASAMYLVIRTSANPTGMVGAAKSAIQIVDKDQPVYNVKTMEEYLSGSVAKSRFTMLLFGVFGGVALVLAAVGLYGVMSYSVTQRTHEIGIRMALGAKQTDVVRLVVGQGMLLAVAGVGIGLGAAFALTRLMSSLLFGVSATDSTTFIAISLILTGVALAASFVPARRASKVDPMVALRYE
ncbi:MAG TPA: ABC transporter permease [Blastocatellia bacterium]|jgi:putative ABC transport system permease protein|nr:ABC transporter permease [Blastocatellia bacterium]